MTYGSLDDLPVNIRSTLPQNLPKQLKDIYLRAFNSVYCRYEAQMHYNNKAKHEKMAHMVAWNIIKTKFLKEDHM